MDSINKKIIWEHDVRKQKQNQDDVRVISVIEAAIWWSAKQRRRFEDDPKTSKITVTKIRIIEEGLALIEILQAIINK